MLVITRGLPGAGKTLLAERLVDLAPPGSMARVNRDDLRAMMHGQRVGQQWQEDQVTAVQRAAVVDLLGAGVDVVVDDTNLPDTRVQEWEDLAARAGAVMQVVDLRSVPVETCIARDAARGAAGGRMVGEPVIREMCARQDRTPMA